MTYSRLIGAYSPHRLEVSHVAWLKLLIVRLNGRIAYMHFGWWPWKHRRPRAFKSPGPEVYFYFVEPPGWTDPESKQLLNCFRLWMDSRLMQEFGPGATLTELREPGVSSTPK